MYLSEIDKYLNRYRILPKKHPGHLKKRKGGSLPLSDENFTLLNLNISEASWPVLIKFYV